MQTFLLGLSLSLGLFSSIGAQNMFVLKHGLMNQYIVWVCLVCVLMDFMFLFLGIMGAGSLFAKSPLFSQILAVAGIIFLLGYGILAFKNAYLGKSAMVVSLEQQKPPLKKILTQTILVTCLNPHVYLDTIVLLGGIGSVLEVNERLLFMVGCMLASCIWFSILGFGSKALRPFFENPTSWRVLDCVVGIVMFVIAFGLLQFIFGD
ncbi:hypothetical protein CCZ01_02045 [Helicobacter monodelphidis]|uniref:LysE/ArgO family amino acid transporter n=1 Tax=Helicobacter sp. 15-1451 TaxID=2004995 RepID=UPI000DCD3279|nr:LysE family transporter [Helicobacter sp. 15-1451]RAX58589.1 hypothetical protein CCZ01_02045 [Helicobacter sp. 15-1451]